MQNQITVTTAGSADAFVEAVHLAQKLRASLDDSVKAIEASLLEALRRRHPPGSILDLRRVAVRESGFSLHLGGVKTMAGKDHGTFVFKVEKMVSVAFSPTHPALSSWVCEAHPVNEVTGKVMNGSVHGANRHGMTTCRLVGRFDGDSWEDCGPEPALRRMAAFIADVGEPFGEARDGSPAKRQDQATSGERTSCERG